MDAAAPGPQTNGKAERFNHTLADEFLHAKRSRSESRAPHLPQPLGPRLQLSSTPHAN